MNNVIRFQPANSQRRMASGGLGAQILFFTGVRYQRMSEDKCAPAPQPRRARRKRQAAETGSGRKSQR
jgi:hypothetical protein